MAILSLCAPSTGTPNARKLTSGNPYHRKRSPSPDGGGKVTKVFLAYNSLRSRQFIRSSVPIGACATSFDRLRSTSLTKSHHCCAATHHCAKRTFLAQRTIPFLASRTERQSLPRFCKIPLKKRLKTLRNRIKRRLFVFAHFSSFRRFAQLFSLVLVCSADFVRRRPILPCFFARYVV